MPSNPLTTLAERKFMLVVLSLGCVAAASGAFGCNGKGSRSHVRRLARSGPRAIMPITWEELDEAIRRVEGWSISSRESIEKCAMYRDLLLTASVGFFAEMAMQTDRPALADAGLYAVEQLAPDRAPRVAAQMLASAHLPWSGSLFPAQRLLKELRDPTEIRRLLELFASAVGLHHDNLILLVSLFEKEPVCDWFDQRDPILGPFTFQAVVFVYCNADPPDDTITGPRAVSRLRAFAACPGYPRYIYAYYGPEEDPDFATLLGMVLADRTLAEHDIWFLARRRAGYIRAHIDIESLGVGQERKKTVEETLELTLPAP